MDTQSHFQEIAANFLQFLEKGFLCDTILVTENRELKAHSILLAAVSPVFRAAFEGSKQPGLQYVELNSFDTETVEIALNYIYTGKLLLSSRYTRVDHLHKLFRRLEDLGLEAHRLNGCEIRFQTSVDSRDSSDVTKSVSHQNKVMNITKAENFMSEQMIPLSSSEEEEAKSVTKYEFNCNKNEQSKSLRTENFVSPNRMLKGSYQSVSALHPVGHESGIERGHSKCNRDSSNDTEALELQVIYTDISDFAHSGLNSSSLAGFELEGDYNTNQNNNLLTSLSNEGFEHNEMGNTSTNTEKYHSPSGTPETDDSDIETLNVERGLTGDVSEFSQDDFIKSEEAVSDLSSALHGYSLLPPDHSMQMDDSNSTGNEKQRFSCNICGKVLTKKAIKSHSLIHSGERPFECSVCGKTFTMAANLLRHSQLHTGLRAHLCHLCGKSFVQKVALQDHLATHLDEKKFKCSKCGKMFLKSKNLTEHNHRMHGDSVEANQCPSVDDRRVILCDYCGKSFTSKLGLKQHTKLHISEKPFNCIHCDKAFLTKQNLAQHMINHTGEKPYVCKICGIAYKRKHLLEWHEHIHTGVKPFVCNVCGKGFVYTCSLKVHTRTHTGERPYECKICGTAYVQSNHLTVHMRTHTGEKPFSCDLCGKSYKNRLDLRLHSSRVHHLNITKSRSVATNNNWQ